MENIKKIIIDIKNNNCKSEKCIEEKKTLDSLLNQYNSKIADEEMKINDYGKYVEFRIDENYNLKTKVEYFYKERY